MHLDRLCALQLTNISIKLVLLNSFHLLGLGNAGHLSVSPSIDLCTQMILNISISYLMVRDTTTLNQSNFPPHCIWEIQPASYEKTSSLLANLSLTFLSRERRREMALRYKECISEHFNLFFCSRAQSATSILVSFE